MVDLFFVLSGFVIALNYIDRLASWRQLFLFQMNRFLRLYPLHLILLLFFLGIEIARYIAVVKFGFETNDLPFSKNSFTAFIANLFLIQNWTMSELTFNYPSWSISAEFFTYAIFALFIFFTLQLSRKAFIYTLLCAILAFGSILILIGTTYNTIPGPSRCLLCFFIGVGFQQIYVKTKEFISISSSIPGFLAVLGTILFVINYDNTAMLYAVVGPLLYGITIFVLIITDQNSAINRILYSRALVYLGTISYGIYMIHAAVWAVYLRLMRFIYKFPFEISSEGGFKIFVNNVYLADLILISGLIAIIILSHLSYQYLEKRFNKLRHSL